MSKGKINTYTCPQGHVTVTIDRDDGVTPFMLRCRQKDNDGKHNCVEFAQSGFYQVDQNLTPEFEWVKIPEHEWKFHPIPMREHFKMGGLEIKKINRNQKQNFTP